MRSTTAPRPACPLPYISRRRSEAVAVVEREELWQSTTPRRTLTSHTRTPRFRSQHSVALCPRHHHTPAPPPHHEAVERAKGGFGCRAQAPRGSLLVQQPGQPLPAGRLCRGGSTHMCACEPRQGRSSSWGSGRSPAHRNSWPPAVPPHRPPLACGAAWQRRQQLAVAPGKQRSHAGVHHRQLDIICSQQAAAANASMQ